MLNAEIDRTSVPPIDSQEMSHTGKLTRARAELEQERNLTSNLSAHRDQLEGRAEKAEDELARARKEIDRLNAPVTDEEMEKFALHYIDLARPQRRVPALLLGTAASLIRARAVHSEGCICVEGCSVNGECPVHGDIVNLKEQTK